MLCFGNVDLGILEYLKENLAITYKDIFSEIIIIDEVRDFPENSFDSERNQYSAPLFLLTIREYAINNSYDMVLGITSLDIFVPVQDHDFFRGQAEFGPDAKAAVLSLHRFYEEFYDVSPNAPLFLLRLLKEAIHETGHILGLNHCRKKCVMMFSEYTKDVDKKPASFCDTCWKKILLFL